MKQREFDSNKQYASEVLAILLQSSSANQQALVDADGIELLLQVWPACRHLPGLPADHAIFPMQLCSPRMMCWIIAAACSPCLRYKSWQMVNLAQAIVSNNSDYLPCVLAWLPCMCNCPNGPAAALLQHWVPPAGNCSLQKSGPSNRG